MAKKGTTPDLAIVAQELGKLETTQGVLTAKAVLKVAQDRDNPLHEYFEWDDTEAAEKYRLSQAENLIRRVKIEVTIDETKVRVVRYVSVQPPAGEYRVVRKLTKKHIAGVMVQEMNRKIGRASCRERV